MITYTIENNLGPEDFKKILVSSTLAERRPVNDDEKISKMVSAANLIITARVDGELIGLARSLSDFAFCTYLSDLAVDKRYQHKGIGKELIKQTKKAAPQAVLILLAAPKAVEYYPKIGMRRHEHCFFITDINEID